jgi:hypothetical protein
MKWSTAISAVALISALSASTPSASAPEFLSYEGKNAVHQGEGGEKKTVDGIDFWSNGAPPRRFKVLGSLTDRRHKTGLVGMVRMSGLDSDIAKAAKSAGGDGVILESEGDETVGVAGSSFTNVDGGGGYAGFHAHGSTSGFANAIKKHDSRYIVVKYLPDDPASAAAPLK